MTSRLNDVVRRPRENFGFDTESDDDVEAGADDGPSRFMAAGRVRGGLGARRAVGETRFSAEFRSTRAVFGLYKRRVTVV